MQSEQDIISGCDDCVHTSQRWSKLHHKIALYYQQLNYSYTNKVDRHVVFGIKQIEDTVVILVVEYGVISC